MLISPNLDRASDRIFILQPMPYMPMIDCKGRLEEGVVFSVFKREGWMVAVRACKSLKEMLVILPIGVAED